MRKCKTYSAEQINLKLREADVLIGQSKTVSIVCKVLKNIEQTYCLLAERIGGKTNEVEKLLHVFASKFKASPYVLPKSGINHRKYRPKTIFSVIDQGLACI